MEFYAIVIYVRVLASYKTRFNQPFINFKKLPVLSQEYDSYYSFVC